ncbi:unnamed protein product [Ectocarpus sp. 13 AM-2016]
MGSPTIMVTFTANPASPEIQENLLPGQIGMDRPDLVNRVFKVKLKHLLADLKSPSIFGKCQYMMYVIEYQARGVVHAHIISPEQKGEEDDWIWTNLPDLSIANGELRRKVLVYMVHKKCGIFNPSAQCMKTNPKTKKKYCQKNYPQPFRSSLQTNKCGRAEHRRLDNGDKATIKCKNGENETVDAEIDNRDIVPYNPYLLMKYNCHICFDLVTAKAVIAYLYKYAYKKEDSVRARVTYKDNEIEAYRSVRYISSSEAMWHIFGFHTQERTPSVNLLYVHREGEQSVIHDEADEPAERQAAADNAVSDLMKYFGRPALPQCAQLTFPQYYEQFSVEQEQRQSKRTRNFVYLKSTSNVGRIQYMSPDQGDIWFLRLLLLNRPASSFRQLRCIDGIEHETYEHCARELALVHDTNEYAICMQEAAQFSTARELRRVFTTLILHGASAPQLWE